MLNCSFFFVNVVFLKIILHSSNTRVWQHPLSQASFQTDWTDKSAQYGTANECSFGPCVRSVVTASTFECTTRSTLTTLDWGWRRTLEPAASHLGRCSPTCARCPRWNSGGARELPIVYILQCFWRGLGLLGEAPVDDLVFPVFDEWIWRHEMGTDVSVHKVLCVCTGWYLAAYCHEKRHKI